MNSSKILICMDFDNTILDCNTSTEVLSLLGDKEIPKDLEALSLVKHGWTPYMRELFKFIAKNDVTQDDYVRLLTSLPLVDGMKDLLQQMHESKGCEIIIVSDSNSFFIQCILRHYQVNGCISKVFTHPAEFSESGCLQIKEFQNQSSCKRCAPSMCKGSVIANHTAKRMVEGVNYQRVLFIGDGANDVCPALRLGPNDYCFARVGHRLLRSLEKMPAKNVRATIVPWETAHDIKTVLLSS